MMKSSSNIKICIYRNNYSQFKDYFSKENGLVFSTVISSLMETFGFEHNPTEMRLFIDSVVSLNFNWETVFLHNRNFGKLQHAVCKWNTYLW